MVRCLSSRWGVVVVVAALSAGGAGLVEAETSIDVRDVYPECRGVLDNIGDGYCDTYGPETNNVEECGFDGGDCCECTCADGRLECELNAFKDCLDVSAECYEEPGPTPSPVAVSEEEADAAADDSSAPPLSGMVTSDAAAAAGALLATALCGGFAAAVGW